MERLPKLPLSMTAVAVVTPSSGSNSAAMLPVVVGADMCPSLFSSQRHRADLRLLLRRAFAVFVPGDRCSIEALGAVPFPSWGALMRPGGHYRGPALRGTDRAASRWSPCGGCRTRKGTVPE